MFCFHVLSEYTPRGENRNCVVFKEPIQIINEAYDKQSEVVKTAVMLYDEIIIQLSFWKDGNSRWSC